VSSYRNLVFVDVEATGISPYSGEMTEFGAVHYTTRETFHGVLFDSMPSPENPAIPVLQGIGYPQGPVMRAFADWLVEHVTGRPVFVSDNPAYDFQWINYYFDKILGTNPFGHSGRRIGDFSAGLNGKWSGPQDWKRLRKTVHDHNPVNDAMGNVEAFAVLVGDV
jgi:DNA polymerase III epsilon subunit-like protein